MIVIPGLPEDVSRSIEGYLCRCERSLVVCRRRIVGDRLWHLQRIVRAWSGGEDGFGLAFMREMSLRMRELENGWSRIVSGGCEGCARFPVSCASVRGLNGNLDGVRRYVERRSIGLYGYDINFDQVLDRLMAWSFIYRQG